MSSSPTASAKHPEGQLDLNRFFPHRLSSLDMAVNQAVAQLYNGRFNLNRQEWRIIATLGSHESMSAKELATYSDLEKMQVSRAVSRLKQADMITQQEDQDDRRYTRLSLSDQGRIMYRKIVPLVLAREEFILSALSETEQEQLALLMDKVYEKALELQQWG